MKIIINTLRISCLLVLSFGMLYSFGRGGRGVVKPAVEMSKMPRASISLNTGVQNSVQARRGLTFNAVAGVDALLRKEGVQIPQDLKIFALTYNSYILAFVGYNNAQTSPEAKLNAFLAYQLVESRNWDPATQLTLMVLTNHIVSKLSQHPVMQPSSSLTRSATTTSSLANTAHAVALTDALTRMKDWDSGRQMAQWKREAVRNCKIPGV